jgi:hypothetical protein
MDELLLERFCGYELFPIAEVRVFVDEEASFLNLEIHSGPCRHRTVPETEFIAGHGYSPTADIWIPLRSGSPADLVGRAVTIRPEDLEARQVANLLHYYESAEMRDVVVRFPESSDGRWRVEVVATTRDPNHYDGSKPDATVRINGWFDLPDARG